MNEVTKLYENAGVEPINFAKQGAIDFTNTIEIDGKRYPDFTAEKQLELIKWLGTTEYYTFGIFYRQGLWYIFTETTNKHNEKFDECLAKLINKLWQSLTEEERIQIREILE